MRYSNSEILPALQVGILIETSVLKNGKNSATRHFSFNKFMN